MGSSSFSGFGIVIFGFFERLKPIRFMENLIGFKEY
jgi:hypothetical protein